jgi:hypothetical protein
MIDINQVPLYATQGGGYANFVNNKLVWHSEIPDYMLEAGAKIGDPIPDEWDFQPANEPARQALLDEEYPLDGDEDSYLSHMYNGF